MEIYNFGTRLKQLRIERELSQEQVAQYLKVGRATVSGYEINKSLPSVEVLADLAILFRTTTDYLLGLDNRSFIALNDLSEHEQQALEAIVKAARAEFKALRYEKSH